MQTKRAFVFAASLLVCATAAVADNGLASPPPIVDHKPVIYKSNGTGGGDWFDPNTWEPKGVPGSECHMDVVKIQSYDVVTQSKKCPYTLGYYSLEDCATHIFSDDADVAALSVDCEMDGRWQREGDIEPLIAVRNAAQAFRPRHARILQVYDCPLYCELLRDAPPPYDTLPRCTNQCEGDHQTAKVKAEQTLKAAHEANLQWTRGMKQKPREDPAIPQPTQEDFRYIRQFAPGGMIACSLEEFRSVALMNLSDSAITDDGLAHLKNHQHLQGLTLTNTAITDTGLAHLAEIKQLGGIALGGTKVNGTGLKHLAGLTKISDLTLSKTPFDDAGTRELAALKNLTGEWLSINLSETRITDESLAILGTIKGIRNLYLGGTRITDARLSELRAIPHLLRLDIRDTKVTDLGLQEISQFKDMCILVLDNTAVTDSGIQSLTTLSKLHTLQLNGTAVSDGCIDHLLRLPKLGYLQIQRTRITPAGVERLKKAKPAIQITKDAP